jgi:hypothetical protein
LKTFLDCAYNFMVCSEERGGGGESIHEMHSHIKQDLGDYILSCVQDSATLIIIDVIVRMRLSNVYIGATLQSVTYIIVSTPFGTSTIQLSVNDLLATLIINGNKFFIPKSSAETVLFTYGNIHNDIVDGVFLITTINIKVQVTTDFIQNRYMSV